MLLSEHYPSARATSTNFSRKTFRPIAKPSRHTVKRVHRRSLGGRRRRYPLVSSIAHRNLTHCASPLLSLARQINIGISGQESWQYQRVEPLPHRPPAAPRHSGSTSSSRFANHRLGQGPRQRYDRRRPPLQVKSNRDRRPELDVTIPLSPCSFACRTAAPAITRATRNSCESDSGEAALPPRER